MKHVLIVLIFSSLALCAATDFQKARLLDVTNYTEPTPNGNLEMYRITVAMEGMVYTGTYDAHWVWSFRPGNLTVGDEIFAKIDKNTLILKRPDGKELKAKIIRREHESTVSSSQQ